jgi:hypothetical protein
VHPARKTNNENNANEVFVSVASSYLPVLSLVAATRENNSKRAALHEGHSAHVSKSKCCVKFEQ